MEAIGAANDWRVGAVSNSKTSWEEGASSETYSPSSSTIRVSQAGNAMNIGILGTARVVPYALLAPAKLLGQVTVAAVASRDRARAREFAALHRIPRAIPSYSEMLKQEDIDAVYVALPTALHHIWTIRALECGKHVLCEKPLAPNAALAEEMVSSARSRHLVLQEGMHFLFLDALHRQRDLITSGVLGRAIHIVCVCRSPNIEMTENDFRLQFKLGGGAALDLGCYAVACLTHIAGETAASVSDVRVEQVAPQVDNWMRAHLRFPSGITGIVECGFLGNYSLEWSISAECERGSIRLSDNELTCVTRGRVVHETVRPTPTYLRQLDAFSKQVRGQPSRAPPIERAITTARILDAMYEGAGLAPRVGWREEC